MTATLKDVFNDEVISQFRKEITKTRKSTSRGMFNNNILDAYTDIIDCIDDESIKDIEELDDYVERNYSENDSDYFIIASIVAFAEEDFEGDVKDLFSRGKKIDLDFESIMDEDNFDDFDHDEEFEGRY